MRGVKCARGSATLPFPSPQKKTQGATGREGTQSVKVRMPSLRRGLGVAMMLRRGRTAKHLGVDRHATGGGRVRGWVHKLRDRRAKQTQTQRHRNRDTETQRHRDTETQRHRHTPGCIPHGLRAAAARLGFGPPWETYAPRPVPDRCGKNGRRG